MLTKTELTVDKTIIDSALDELPGIDFRLTINEPTGNFFYDPWIIKSEYEHSPWADLLRGLTNIGEARIIVLGYGKCYQAHADIDDRYHLTLQTDNSYLIDLDNNNMHRLNVDGIWYDMDAGRLHSAVNFGYQDRIQLVVRKLLLKNNLKEPVYIRIRYVGDNKDSARFKFDSYFSPWLNRANKQNIISDFSFEHNDVRFKMEKSHVQTLKEVSTEEFHIDIS